MPDHRRKQGRRHSLQLCLALFTLAVVAGNQGFLAFGDWLESYKHQLKELFKVERLPSYSTLRITLLELDYKDYSCRLASFFEITAIEGETLAVDGKVLRGSYLLSEDNPYCEPHKAITLVSAYLVERGLILKPQEVKNKSNDRTTPLPQVLAIAKLAVGIARNLAINLYRDAGFSNMAQAPRKCSYSLEHILSLFRMK